MEPVRPRWVNVRINEIETMPAVHLPVNHSGFGGTEVPAREMGDTGSGENAESSPLVGIPDRVGKGFRAGEVWTVRQAGLRLRECIRLRPMGPACP